MKVFYEIYEVTFPVTFFITVRPGSLPRTKPGEKTPGGQKKSQVIKPAIFNDARLMPDFALSAGGCLVQPCSKD